MFNTYVTKRTEYIPYEKTVKEIKSPTDDSIRLYEEIRGKAMKNIVETIHVKDQYIDAVIVVFQNDMSYSDYSYKVRFKINGQDYLVDGKLDSSTLCCIKGDVRMVFIKTCYDAFMRVMGMRFAEMVQENLKHISL